MIKKKGYFFTLDAFIGLTILAVGIMLLYSSYSYEPDYEQPHSIAQDVAGSVSQISLNEFNSAVVDSLRDSGDIKSMDNTVMEQIAVFYINNEMALASRLAEAILTDVVPEQYDFSLLLEDNVIYGSAVISDRSKAVASSKVLVMGIISKTEMFGPLKAEVNVWQR